MQTISFHFHVDGNESGPGSCWSIELDGKTDHAFFFGSGIVIKNFPIDILTRCLSNTFSIDNGKLQINARSAWKEIYKNPENPALQILANSWESKIMVMRSYSQRQTEIMSEFNPHEGGYKC